jgi:hypothetical protein
LRIFCLGWPLTLILLIPASLVVRIIGVNHQGLARTAVWKAVAAKLESVYKGVVPHLWSQVGYGCFYSLSPCGL